MSRKQILLILLLSFAINSCAQNKSEEIIEEVITDSNGKIISKDIISKDKKRTLNSEDVLEEFYSNLKNIDELDKLISHRFYQKSPYVKFKEGMETKYKLCGEFIDKEIVETEYSADKKAVRLKLNVKYEKKKTIEQIVLIKESENSDFNIFEYNIKIVE